MKSRHIFFVALISVVLPALAKAGTREDVQAAAVRCASMPDDRSWLNCFYSAADPMRKELGLAPLAPAQPGPVSSQSSIPAASSSNISPQQSAPTVVSTPRPQAPVPATSKGWFQDIFGSTRSPYAPVVSRMQSYSFNQQGLFTVSLVNGQVWQQADANRARWRMAASSYNIVIKPDPAGNFVMAIQNTQESYTVRRLR